VAVASAGPYASLHLAPDRQPRQHHTTRFLKAGCPSCRPTKSVEALKAQNCSGSGLFSGLHWELRHRHHRRRRVASEGRCVVASPCPRSTARFRSPEAVK